MKRILLTAFLFACITIASLSCEKDDICADGTPTTPSVVIEFYNKDIQDEPRNVPGLRYYVVGMQDTLPGTGQPAITGNRIRVPLRVDAETTTWAFVRSTPTENTDIITFNYTTQQLYVSRACGFKSIFLLNEGTEETPNPQLTDGPGGDNLWIESINVVNPNIETENPDEAHIHIFF